MTFKTLTALGILSAGLGVAFVGCSSDDTDGGGGGTDAGNKDTGSDTSTPGQGPTQKGQLVDLLPGNTNQGVSQPLTIDLGEKRGTANTSSNPKGTYSIAVGNNNPFYMRVSGSGYLTLIEQEWSLSGDADRGKTPVPTSGIATALAAGLKALAGDIDKTKGALGVSVVPLPPCTDNGGAEISLDTGPTLDAGSDAGDSGDAATDAGASDAGTTKLATVYFTNGQPSNAKNVQSGQLVPSALLYNVPVGDVRIKVSNTSCKQITEYPIADPQVPNIKYTGKAKVEAAGDIENGNGTLSFVRIFLTK